MTKQEYDSIEAFPIEMVSTVRYKSEKLKLKKGDTFIAVEKRTLGQDDFSFIDSYGSPHYFTGCEILLQDI